jgi:hypothetical protein
LLIQKCYFTWNLILMQYVLRKFYPVKKNLWNDTNTDVPNKNLHIISNALSNIFHFPLNFKVHFFQLRYFSHPGKLNFHKSSYQIPSIFWTYSLSMQKSWQWMIKKKWLVKRFTYMEREKNSNPFWTPSNCPGISMSVV